MKYISTIILLLVGIGLTTVNLFGLTQDIRPKYIFNDELRFINDQPLSFESAMSSIYINERDDLLIATHLTQLVSQSLAHIHWEKYPVNKFNQMVPIWENYFLYFMGVFTSIPEYKRYHFTNYERSLKRGIGICGDASMVLSQLLDKYNIDNKILTFPGHVVILALLENEQEVILDPDFGVVVPFDTQSLAQNYEEISTLYLDAGYSDIDANFFKNMYQQRYRAWDGVSHLITKKYYFEIFAYWAKWPLPLFLILFSIWRIKKARARLSR